MGRHQIKIPSASWGTPRNSRNVNINPNINNSSFYCAIAKSEKQLKNKAVTLAIGIWRTAKSHDRSLYDFIRWVPSKTSSAFAVLCGREKDHEVRVRRGEQKIWHFR